jgi:hypothetical protein
MSKKLTYAIPLSARNNARKVLRWREEHGDAVAGMTAVGWTRANQLATQSVVSRDTAKRIKSFFARHGAQPATFAVAPEFENEPWRDAGNVANYGWGGPSMAAVAAKWNFDDDE